MPGEVGALSSYRALDLSNQNGQLCGKILAELGADVIKIEPPSGDATRRRGPFYHDEPHLEKSLFWFAFNTSKRGITLNLESADGREIFQRLVKTADFVIETFPPGYLDSKGLGYAELSKINPRLILTSITPFGQTGPHRDYLASDIVSMAMSGLMYICGDEERPPVRFSVPQSFFHAGGQAAAGTMIAHHARESTGEGQHVDVSVQEAVTMATYHNQQFWHMHQFVHKRYATRWELGPPLGFMQVEYAAKEGYISGGVGGSSMPALLEWLALEGLDRNISDSLKNRDWTKLDSFRIEQEERDQLEEAVNQLMLRHSADELYEGALKRRIMWFKVNTPKGIVESPQLTDRGFFVSLDHPELGDAITYPGAPVKLSETPWRVSGRAPLIGEHNMEILHHELGLSKQELTALRQAGAI